MTVTPAEVGGSQRAIARAAPNRVALPRWQDADVESPFGSPEQWRHDDLIGVSRVFDPELALAAYQCGVFPMPTRPGLMGWYSPLERAVLPLNGLRISRSLRKSMRRYQVRIDTAFDDVLDGCADRRRPSGWINREIRRVYRRLHKRGVVHSVEAWTSDGELAGGLYGVSIGGLFAGESMFYRPGIGRDASKVALVALVNVLRRSGRGGSATGRAVADSTSGIAWSRGADAGGVSPATCRSPTAADA